MPGSPDGGLPQLLPDLGADSRPRGLLDDLLVAPLHRAVPLEEVDVVAVLVPEHLNLDVARRLHVLLYQHHLRFENAFLLRHSYSTDHPASTSE